MLTPEELGETQLTARETVVILSNLRTDFDWGEAGYCLDAPSWAPAGALHVREYKHGFPSRVWRA